MCRELLANPLIEASDRVGGVSIRRVAVLVFPGSNDDSDAAWALGRSAPTRSSACGGVCRGTARRIPSGFSYGDYLRWRDCQFAPVLGRPELAAAGAVLRDLQRLPDPL